MLQPGLEPGPSDPESSSLTTGLLTPHMKYQMLSAWSGLVSAHKNVNHRLRELCYVQTL